MRGRRSGLGRVLMQFAERRQANQSSSSQGRPRRGVPPSSICNLLPRRGCQEEVSLGLDAGPPTRLGLAREDRALNITWVLT